MTLRILRPVSSICSGYFCSADNRREVQDVSDLAERGSVKLEVVILAQGSIWPRGRTNRVGESCLVDAKLFQDRANEHEAKLKGENAAVLDAPSSILLLATCVNTNESCFFFPHPQNLQVWMKHLSHRFRLAPFRHV